MTFAERVIPPWLRAGSRTDELAFLPASLEIMETPPSPVGRAIAATIATAVCLALAWAWIGEVDIIATSQGKIIPTGRTKLIQPLESGVVSAIRVAEGDRVVAGQPLVELDRTVATAERNRTANDHLHARLDAARLRALRGGLEGDLTPVDFSPPTDAPEYLVLRTRAMMLSQANQQRAKIASLDQQIAQKVAEADSLAATIDKLATGLPLIEETAEVRRKAMSMEFGNRIAHLEAQLKLNEQRQELVVQRRRVAELTAARQALERQREQAQAEYAQGIVADLSEAEQKATGLAEDLVKADKKVEDQILRAPVAGTVQQLAISTIGGVVTPAQQLMVVVPADSRIEAEVMVQNRDIGFVAPGQKAEIKIDTFNFTRYGLLHGDVVTVSQDAIVRERPADKNGPAKANSALSETSEPQGQEYVYSARISLAQTRMLIDGRMVDLAPGMAVTAEITTGRRRIIEYLLSPLMRYQHDSLRER
jgi:membrane fusion protein, hemolysin D